MKKLIERAMVQVRLGKVDTALDLIHKSIEDFLKEQKLDLIDDLIENSDCDTVDENILICILTATLPVKSKLKNRGSFFESVKNHLIEKEGSDKTVEILAGLK